jgi:hypothetical protein
MRRILSVFLPVLAFLFLINTTIGSPSAQAAGGNGVVNPINGTLPFGTVAVGTNSTPLFAHLKNTSATNTIGTITTALSDTTNYSISDSCTGQTIPVANILAANVQFCFVMVTFHPTSAGAHNATLDILTDAANDFPGAPVGRFRYTLTGTGAVGPVVSFNPASPLNLGSLSVGSTGVPQNVRLTNTGTSPLNITTLTTGGTNPGDFVFSNNCSAGAIVTGGSCIISATFRPTAAGARSATISVADDATGTPQIYTFNGTGTVGPAVTFSPASPLNLGSVGVGNSGIPQNVRLTNTGNSSLNITTLTPGGTNPGVSFSDTCAGSAVSVGGSCTISATLKPTAVGREARRFRLPMTRRDRLKFIHSTAPEPWALRLVSTPLLPLTLGLSM